MKSEKGTATARRITALLLGGFVLAVLVAPVMAQEDETRTICFAEGQWDADRWTPLKLPEHPELRQFIQRPESVGTTSFTPEEVKQHLDNVLLMTDTGLDEGQFEVQFGIGPEKGTAPGVFLSPTTDGDTLQTSIAVFVADYTMAVWRSTTNPETGKTDYEHLVRLARYQDPAERHTLRARWSRARRMMALQVDDSSVVILRLPEHEINSKVGIWGCHGTCDFYEMTITAEGTLPWSGTAPE
ncbi:MAG: hypothetical protein ACOCX2_08040 [Armatimonadota bacterium]